MLEILYQDSFLVAINKPHGLLVHASKIARNAEEFALQLLRDQLNQKVFPCHRLDRKTAGVLIFALDSETHREMSNSFMNNEINKEYLTIVRGHCPESGTIDYPLINEKNKSQEAITHFTRISTSELDIPQGKFETSRYSHVKVEPITGRTHQIRRHFAHIFHPIIGDRPHGCNKQNKLFLEQWNMNTMLLHCKSMTFNHPKTNEHLTISARLHEEFTRMKYELNL